MKSKYFYFSILIVLAISSCKKPDEFPVIPVITYKEIYIGVNSQGYDEAIRVLLNFTDGDGDIGYHADGEGNPIYDDPTSIYYNNYVATLFEFKNGVWTEYPTIVPLGGRLPYLTPVGKNKTLKGEISCDFAVPPGVPDTIPFRLDIFIYDRSLNKSNVISTPEFLLHVQ